MNLNPSYQLSPVSLFILQLRQMSCQGPKIVCRKFPILGFIIFWKFINKLCERGNQRRCVWLIRQITPTLLVLATNQIPPLCLSWYLIAPWQIIYNWTAPWWWAKASNSDSPERAASVFAFLFVCLYVC